MKQPNSRIPAASLLWGVIGVVAVVYAPLAFESMWSYFGHVPNLQVRLAEPFFGHRFLFGPGGGVAHGEAVYPHSRWWLLVHTTLASTALLIGAFQFAGRLRRRRPRLHRSLGRIYMTLTPVAMVGAIGYLLRTPASYVFSGAPFAWALGTIAAGTIVTVLMAFLAIRRRDVRTHQRLMYLNYALMLTAPVLRIEWAVLHVLLPGAEHATVNLVSALSLGPQVIAGAIVATRLSDRAPAPAPRARALPGTGVERAIFAAGALGLAWLSAFYAARIGRPDVLLVGGLVIPGTAMWCGFGLAAHRARQRGNEEAAADWRIHFLALTLAPVSVAVILPLATALHGSVEGFFAAANVGWPVAMFAGYMVMVAQRRRATVTAGRPQPRATVAA